ncbi:hypothetical protein JTP77_042555, partial [Streptomyces sp. S9]|nr:hypothetical protein [Streptomyces sp. S9]
ALAALLTLTLGSSAQTSLRWQPANPSLPAPVSTDAVARGQGSDGTAPQGLGIGAPANANVRVQPLAAGFDVQQFEAMAQAMVADQRIP